MDKRIILTTKEWEALRKAASKSCDVSPSLYDKFCKMLEETA